MVEKIGSLQLFYDWFVTYICQKRDLATSDYRWILKWIGVLEAFKIRCFESLGVHFKNNAHFFVFVGLFSWRECLENEILRWRQSRMLHFGVFQAISPSTHAYEPKVF